MNVLVAGASGNVGRAMVEESIDRGHSVVGLVHHAYDDPTDGAHYLICRTDHLLRAAELPWRFDMLNTPPFDLILMAQGFQAPTRLENLTHEKYYDIMNANLNSPTFLTSVLLSNPELLSDNALIVYCSSIQAATPRAGRGIYAIAKAGIEALARQVAVEGSRRGIRAVALRLGQLTETMGGIRFSDEEKFALRERAYSDWPSPEDVARFALDLYKYRGVNGSVVDMDSGHGRNVW